MVTLHGYKYSVYAWIARFVLAEKGVAYTWREVNPFAADVPEDYLVLHPFKRVPVLVKDAFAVYETGAITRFVDEAFGGPRLQPSTPESRARMSQLISIADSYAYWPMVRQIFAHGVFGPLIGRPCDPAEVTAGLAAVPCVLRAVETLAGPGDWLVDDAFGLADVHWGPMMAYFAMHESGATLLQEHPRIARWWTAISNRRSFIVSQPELPLRSA